MRAFWYKGVKNFGDELTPWLLKKHGITATWTHPNRARFFGCGSIGGKIPEGFSGVVWGTGKMWAHVPLNVERATVLALRGPLSGEAPVYADPGLLCSLYAPEEEKRWDYGIISHYIERLPHEGQRIDIQSGPEAVIRAAARSRRIISNSLHGLILADSLGIPNCWVYSDKVIGEGFKFRDYAASFGETIEPEVWRLAPQQQVQEKQAALAAALKGM